MNLLMLHNILAFSGLMLIRWLENKFFQDFNSKCCLKNNIRMSIAAKFRQQVLAGLFVWGFCFDFEGFGEVKVLGSCVIVVDACFG